MKIEHDLSFSIAKGCPYMVYPNIFKDNRGYFAESFKDTEIQFNIKQINRSVSCKWSIRGFHAQKKPFCQAKIVEAINAKIFDIIIDARPDSTTFGQIQAYVLNPELQNKLFIPRGFLHGFLVPNIVDNVMFQYLCDNIYDKASEVGANPKSVLDILEKYNTILSDMSLNSGSLTMSEKDMKNPDLQTLLSQFASEYNETGQLWYE